MENTVNERIESIIKECGYKSRRSFAEKIGVAQTSLNDILRGAEPKFSTLLKIIKAEPLISAEWLLTGIGSMYKNDSVDVVSETRPRIPYDAAAGTLTDTVDGVSATDCEQVPVVKLFPRYDFTIRVTGRSMEPELYAGDEVACLHIGESRFLQWGRVHVLDTTQGVVIKRIYEDGESIRCSSYNKDYPDFLIPKEEVRSYNLVVGVIRL